MLLMGRAGLLRPRNAWLEDNHRFDLSITVYRKGVRDRGTSLNVS